MKQDGLNTYVEEVRRWNRSINLFSARDIDRFEERHLDQALRLARLIPDGGTYADLGTGGGVPGLVVAYTRRDSPGTSVLIERDQRKAAFLRHVTRQLNIGNALVAAKDIMEVSRLDAKTVSARALAPLSTLLRFVQCHAATDGQAFLMKGRNWKDEVEAAQKSWHFDLSVVPDHGHADSVVLVVGHVSKRTP